MKIITIFLITALAGCTTTPKYFEGELTFSLEVIKKDSSFDLNRIPSAGVKTSRLVCKNGSFVQWPDGGSVEYHYFNRSLNEIFYKLRNMDTLLLLDYSKLSADLDPVLSVNTQANADTVLGRICNRLTLKTRKMTLSFSYDPSLAIDPDWYKNTLGGYYNILYGNTKAVYLKFSIEADQFISKGIATEIIQRPVPDTDFPNVDKLPKQKL
jgi:hypothetical protein